MKTPSPSFNEEMRLWRKGIKHVIGLDEVGRGAFAGPVVAAAVIMPSDSTTDYSPQMKEINDSKLLTPSKRKMLAAFIQSHCIFSAISTIHVPVINRIGIGKAAYCAFRDVLTQARKHYGNDELFALIDGFGIPRVSGFPRHRQKAIIHGDTLSISIAAASIVAKVHRDAMMDAYHTRYKEYNFKQNKGYGTREHRACIGKFGLSKLHRRSFALEKFLHA